MAKPKKAILWSKEAVKNHVERMKKMRSVFTARLEEGEKLKIFFSEGNRKLGAIPSVSTIPVVDCPNSALCGQLCYDVTHDCVNKQCAISRALNSAVLHFDIDNYFSQVAKYLKREPEYFRYNIGGDITCDKYFELMVSNAVQYPQTQFLAFTKTYWVVNKFIDNGGVIPDNLHIVFSVWPGLKCDNPHNMPTSHLLYVDGSTTAKPFAFYCPGNCTACCIAEKGCFFMKPGQQVLFPVH